MNVENLHEPVNLGNPGEFTIKQLAEEVIKICGSRVGIYLLAFARRRSAPAKTRHHQSTEFTWLEPDDTTARRFEKDS